MFIDYYFLFVQVDVLNRERADLHKLRIRASIRSIEDGSDIDLPGAEADVWVYVLDTNDLSPLFYPAEYEVNVPEDAPLHTSLVAVKADDADVGINGEIYYSLAEPSEQFAVHPLTGAVSLTRPLVFAEQPFHELVVLAQDRGPQLGALAVTVAAASRAKVRIHVLRVNQHEPRIYVKHLPEVVEQSQVCLKIIYNRILFCRHLCNICFGNSSESFEFSLGDLLLKDDIISWRNIRWNL